MINRRQLLTSGGAALALSLMPTVQAQTRGSVIVVGGGMAGATAAKYLRMWAPRLDVTLVERSATYTSCIFSSLVLSGQRKLGDLQFNYRQLARRYGVRVVQGEVGELDPIARRLRLADGRQLSADRIVLAPGIEFDEVPGLVDPNRMPHAWKAGPQTTLLRNQLVAMPAGGTVILTIPKVPYRCPPGPYERACLIADWLRVNKPRSKLLVLDANPDFVTEKDNFSRAFTQLYANIVQYVPNAEVFSADSVTMTLDTMQGSFRGDVINLIPRQRAGQLITRAALANATEGRFAGVNVLNYESTAAPGVHVIGDSSATSQPKAGHIANQEAKVCADAIIRAFDGLAPDPAPVTNSACFSTITMTQASWLEAVFQYDPASRLMQSVPAASGASAGWSKDHFEDMEKWFKVLMSDSYA